MRSRKKSIGDLRQWAHRHRAFRDGIDRWHLNAFVTSLSAVLHSAVIIFLVGLLVRLFTRDIVIFGIIFVVTLVVVGFDVAATLAPLFDATCPTATPLIIYGRRAVNKLLYVLRYSFSVCSRRSSLRGGAPNIETHDHWADNGNAPWDLDVALPHQEEIYGARRDIQILLLMVTLLPAGNDVDVALDAVGGLNANLHRPHLQGISLSLIRTLTRRRLEYFGEVTRVGATDPATVARALRSSIFIESSPERPHWNGFETMITGIKSIRTHGVLGLSVALQLHLQHPQPLRLQDLELPLRQIAAQLPQQLSQMPDQVTHLLRQLPQLEQQTRHVLLQQLPQLEQRLQETLPLLKQLLLDRQLRDLALDPIAQWNLQMRPDSGQPISLLVRTKLFEEIINNIPVESETPSLGLNMSAVLMVAFGVEPSLRQRCHEFVTPLAASSLGRVLFA